MARSRKLAGLALAAGLAIGGLTASTAAASTSSCGGSGQVSMLNGTLPDGATYLIQCPAGAWNGTLYLYSHGYVVPGAANPAQDAGDPVTAAWMLSQGYALAGSSYASTGWAIAQALPDQISTLDAFGSTYGQPKTTVAWGHSLGGIITAGLLQDYPNRFAAALPMCGVLSGGVATWNTALDGAFAFQKLIDPSVQVVNITDPTANLQGAEAAVAQAQQTPQGQARLALVAALGDTPGWFDAAVARTRRHRLRRPGAQPVLLGQPGDLPVRLRLPRRPAGQGGRQPVVEHRRELLQRPGQVGRPQRGQGALPGRRAQPGPRRADAEQLPADQRRPQGHRVPGQEHLLQRRHRRAGAYHAHHRGRPGRAGERAGVPPGCRPRRSRRPAPPDLREPRRALRVHPSRDHHRGPDAGEPDVHRALERAEPGRDEQPGGGARCRLQHLPRQRPDGPDPGRPGLHQLHSGALPAAIRPVPAFRSGSGD